MGQTVIIVGAKSNDRVSQNDKFRVTWRWTLAELGAGAFFDSRRFDLNIQEALPGLGFLPASAPAAAPGDEVVVYDVRLLATWGAGGKSVADVVAQLDKLPFFADMALDVSRIEKLNPNTTSAELAAGQATAREQGNQASAADRAKSNPFTSLLSFGKGLTAVAVVAVVGVAGFVAYTWSKR